MDVKGETAPALGISLNAQFAAGRQLVFQTHVDQNISPSDLQQILVKFNSAVDAEEAFYALPDLEKSVEVNKNQMYLIEMQMNEIDGRGRITARGAKTEPTAKDMADRSNAVKSKERAEELLKKSQELLEDTRKKAAGRNGTASATDR